MQWKIVSIFFALAILNAFAEETTTEDTEDTIIVESLTEKPFINVNSPVSGKEDEQISKSKEIHNNDQLLRTHGKPDMELVIRPPNSYNNNKFSHKRSEHHGQLGVGVGYWVYVPGVPPNFVDGSGVAPETVPGGVPGNVGGGSGGGYGGGPGGGYGYSGPGGGYGPGFIGGYGGGYGPPGYGNQGYGSYGGFGGYGSGRSTPYGYYYGRPDEMRSMIHTQAESKSNNNVDEKKIKENTFPFLNFFEFWKQ